MSNDGSLGGGVAPNTFDFNSQKGVANILSSVRASTISPSQKNEIRDLIFQYMNSGMDHTVRISLEQKLISYKITMVASPSKISEQKAQQIQYPFGTSRPSPIFPTNTTTFNPIDKPSPTKSPAPIEPESTVQPANLVPEVVPVEPENPIKAEITNKNEDTYSPPPASSQISPNFVTEAQIDPSQSLQRIKEIKSAVNERIGNPVNLVDINNEVGREYMSAMLDAMKKLNTGSTAVSAMKRLEDAYQMVEKTLSEYQNKPDNNEDTSGALESGIAPNEVVSEEVSYTPTPTREPSPVSTPRPKIIPPTVPENTESIVSDEVNMPTVENPQEGFDAVPVGDSGASKFSLEPHKSEESKEPKEETHSVNQKDQTWSSDNETQQVPDGKAHSLAESKVRLRKPEDLPLSSAIETSSVSGDPLYTREVDDGLQQLLSEWPIFKKSGFFGTGPKGREHPLFIKVASLQIPLLLAGRFEGATQEIKQSITDYMNG